MSAIAKLNELGTPEIIPNSDGERIMPSVINFSDNSLLIGMEAKNSAADDPSRVAKEFKREMHNSDYRFRVDNKEYIAHELSGMILKKLAQDASEQIGEIKDVVITVPAYFKENQRNATMEAGKLAGLNVIAIINEPTAAALFYSKESNIQGKGIVYDLGGGTFDITMTQTNGNNIKVIASEGDSKLGGVDFDKVILDLIKEKYKDQTGGELCSDAESVEEFSLMAEEIKKSLSKKPSLKKKLRSASGSATVEISREEFEEHASILISKTEMLLEQLLDDTDTNPSEVDYVLLVGGSTRIPAIRESLKSIIGKEPLNAVNVDEVVALGAAIKAGISMGELQPAAVSPGIKSGLSNLVVQDVANHSHGTIVVENGREKNVIIIEKNTLLPCTEEIRTSLMHDDQTSVECIITQGEGDDPDYVDIIDTYHLTVSLGAKAGEELRDIYSYDENQIMHCKTIHLLSGNYAESSMHLKAGKSSTQVENSGGNPLDEFLIE